MTENNRAFRDYATRVSFNLTLSRNQIANLRHIVFELENEPELSKREYLDRANFTRAAGADYTSMWFVGFKSLERMGLISHHPRWTAIIQKFEAEKAAGKRVYMPTAFCPQYALTPAGEHVVELLRISGLIHQRANNSNRRGKRRAA
jgi:hypothetical protein